MTSLDDHAPASATTTRVLVFAALTMAVVSTLGTPLIPTIAAQEDVTLEDAQWLITITLLVGAVVTPVLGRLGDGRRRKQVLAGTLAAVVAGSVVAATATSFSQLLVGRALQGIGYGTVPLAIAFARGHLDAVRQRRAIAALSVTVAGGAGLGFPLTGLIAQHFDYHVAFWFGGAFSALSLAAVLVLLPNESDSDGTVRVDFAGAALFGLSLAALLLAVSRGVSWGWTSGRIVGLLAASALGLAGWIALELAHRDPLVDLRLSAQPAVLGANAAAVLMGAGMYVGLSLVNRLVQTPTSAGYGFSASLVVAGLILLPLSVGSLAAQPVTQIVSARFGVRAVLPTGATLVGVTLFGAAFAHNHLFELIAVTALLGVGIGSTFAAMPALIVTYVPQARTASAMSLNQVLRSVGGAMGSALAASVLAAKTSDNSPFPSVGGYRVAFVLGALLCALAAVVTVLLVPTTTVAAELKTEVAGLVLESGAGADIAPSVFDDEVDSRWKR